LPSFARPHFIRLMSRLPLTETFKVKKQALARDGFDIGRLSDPVYLLDPARGAYQRLDPDLHDQLLRGELRL